MSSARQENPPVPRRILVIEDDEDAREAMRALLELSGHSVDVARNGAEGLELARAARPDIALIDIGLPEMDGHEVARQLRATPEGKGMVLVALTGYGMPEGADTDFDAHLVKPVDMERLSAILDRLSPPTRT